MPKSFFSTLFVMLLAALVSACGSDDPPEAKKAPRKTLVTISPVVQQSTEIQQTAIGSLEGLVDPTLAAEVAARVKKVHVSIGQTVKQGQLIATLDATDYYLDRKEAQAEVARVQAQLENQMKTVERNQALVDKNFISQNAVDNEKAQENVYKQQLAAAKARVASINHDSSKSRITAPVSGVIDQKLVDTGDYVRVGDPIVKIVAKQILRAHLPFPEQMSAKLKPGQVIRLKTPSSEKIIETVISELKPMIAEGNRTIDVIADVKDAEGWQPGASVTGTVVLGKLESSMMIPEQSLVLRPAGEVVYVIKDNIAYQTIVETGLRQNGFVQVLSGLAVNDQVAVDGAGFLTDQAPVKVADQEVS